MVLPAHHLVGIVGGRAEPMARLERSIDRALDANVPRGNGATDQQGFGLIACLPFRVGTATLRTRFGYLVGCRKRHDLHATIDEEWVGTDSKGVRPILPPMDVRDSSTARCSH
jgi:hypothetical protein